MRYVFACLSVLLSTYACTGQAGKSLEQSQGANATTSAPSEPLTTSVMLADSLATYSTMAEAQQAARSGDAQILVVFAGSDWCRPCKQFKVSVLDDAGFRQNLSDELVVLYLDFPSKRRNQLPAEQTAHNERYAEKYNPQGLFPRLLIVDVEEELVGELSYAGEEATSFEAQVREVLDKR